MDRKVIYADNAATAPLENEALQAMLPFMKETFYNPSSLHTGGTEARQAVEDARKNIAESIGADPEEIIFTSGGTESDSTALRGTAFTAGRNEVITSESEHHAVLGNCRYLEDNGISVKYLPPESDGKTAPETLKKNISERTALVSLMTVNNETGAVNNIKELADIAHGKGALFHTDAVQAVGQMTLSVRGTDIDLLSASAHKFGGPKGIGFLYVKKGTLLSPLFFGGSQERNIRPGTENVPAIAGMAKALESAVKNVRKNYAHKSHLDDVFMNVITDSGIDFKRNGKGMPGLISLSLKGADAEALLYRLDLMGICISTGAACDSVNNQVSHVLKAINLPREYAEGTIRISFGKNNTVTEAIAVASAIAEIIKAG